jgi:glycine hydroxymethyltransferase
VLEAAGTALTNKYAEGYPGNRYYGGCQHVDEAETLAIERAKKLFKCRFANVQSHSGSTANQEAFMALMRPGDTFMGLSLAAGGHLTHGSPVNLSGKWFKVVPYGVRRQDQRIDMDEVATLARQHKPKVIVTGGSAYPRIIDFAAFRAIADEVGAYLMVDMAHFAGLVAGGAHPSPFPHAHVVTSTTHKTLRGPRGAMILTNEEDLSKKINSAVFPGMQGGPLMHVIAAKAVAFQEALQPEFKAYARAVVENCKALGEVLASSGFDLVSAGSDTHLQLVDLRPKKLTGNVVEKALGRAHITVNKNGVPFDPEKPAVTSGIRIGSPAGTARCSTAWPPTARLATPRSRPRSRPRRSRSASVSRSTVELRLRRLGRASAMTQPQHRTAPSLCWVRAPLDPTYGATACAAPTAAARTPRCGTAAPPRRTRPSAAGASARIAAAASPPSSGCN